MPRLQRIVIEWTHDSVRIEFAPGVPQVPGNLRSLTAVGRLHGAIADVIRYAKEAEAVREGGS